MSFVFGKVTLESYYKRPSIPGGSGSQLGRQDLAGGKSQQLIKLTEILNALLSPLLSYRYSQVYNKHVGGNRLS